MRLSLALGFLLFTSVATAAPPNVVLIVSDDHAWTDYGFMRHPHVKTPHLDKLAAQSLAFTRGYVPTSLCCPSLASLVTGLYPHQHKVTSNDPPLPAGMKAAEFQKSQAFLDGRERMNKHLEAVPTLPKLLAENGYRCLQTGKWWQGDFKRGGFTHGMTKGVRHGDEGLDIGRKTMQPIYDFIGESTKEGKPFFVWYAPMMPHTPHNPPAELLKKYEGKGTPSEAKYWAMIEWFDQTCGELLNHLDEKKLTDNTIVVYLADNGWIQDPKGTLSVRSKRTPYDAGLRTPILLRWPGRVKPRVAEELAISLDIMPTLLNACDIVPPKDLPGVSLLDVAALKGRTTLFGECFTHNAVDLDVPAKSIRHRWVIDGHWKLIVPHVPADADGPGKPELYDLAADPEEKTDLAAGKPEQVKALTAKLDAWWNPGR
ncbi:sulfatase family protein [Limnoglobus roseus]|uniref:Sulfatase n=1 Tax=Limnoglobus roseus TaxID=2598579 RepID=A0A5C1AC47_9BACT|nr:sulfatase [Limnoglobus roseus]QEL15767.1 sulfatase [Limnoglobus roseus]